MSLKSDLIFTAKAVSVAAGVVATVTTLTAVFIINNREFVQEALFGTQDANIKTKSNSNNH